jgi:DNA topoisomerase-1
LVTALEKYGIGRPSTYAPIIETLKQRRYVETLRRQFVPTPLGVAVYQWLTEYFPQIMDLEFTARMEEKLDGVEHGQTDWVEVLRQFYDQFVQWVRTAEHSKPRPIEGETCPRCGGQMLQRFSRYGRFAGCERYPECGYVRDLGWPLQQQCPRCGQALELAVSKTEALEVKCSNQACDYVKRNDVAEEEEATPGDNEKTCPACGRPMVLRRYRGGKTFWGCSGYPECQHAEPHGAVQKKPPVDTDLDCPMCGEKLVVRHGRRGPFLGCGNYPKCQYTRNLTEAEKTQYLQVSQRADAPKEAQNQGSGREGPRKSAKTAKAGRSQGPKDGGQDGGGGR